MSVKYPTRLQYCGDGITSIPLSRPPAAPADWSVRSETKANTSLSQKAAYASLWFFVFVMPWENAVTIPGFGTVSRAAGLLALGVGLLAIVDSGRVRVPAVQHLLMAMFVTWAGLTYFWSFEPMRTRIEVISFVQLLVMVWLIWQFAQTRKEQILLLRAFVLGSAVSASAIVFSFLTGPSTGAVGYYNRYSGFGFNPGDLALILALSLPVSLYLAVTDETLRLRVGLYGAHLVLALSGILLAASRGALIASSGMLLMIPFAYAHLSRRQKTVGFAIVAILGVAAGFAVPQTSWSRLGTIGAEVKSGTLNERTMIWQAGWAVFSQSPFGGVGVGAFAPTVQHALGMPFRAAMEGEGQGQQVVELVAHNTFISVLVEQGVIGFALFLGILLALLLAALRFPVLDRAFWLSVLITWTIGVSSLTWEARKPSWLIFGLLAAAAGVQVPLKRRVQAVASQEHSRNGWNAQRSTPDRTLTVGRYS